MSNLDKLIAFFEKFPGIGGRQAKRFAFHILTMTEADTKELARLITELKATVAKCGSCHRFFSKNEGGSDLCSICSSSTRDHKKLLVVERDSDIQAIERSNVYDGLYFVLGGTVPLLNAPDVERLRSGILKATVDARLKSGGLSEIILGFAVNPDGENTARFITSVLEPLLVGTPTTLSHLGRGLSTGSELEYADPDTIKNALKNRA